MISSPNNKTMIATTIATATNTPVSGVTTNTPKTRQSTPVAPAPAADPAPISYTPIYTKEQKKNAFGDKLLQQVDRIINNQVISQQVTDRILDLSEHDIVPILIGDDDLMRKHIRECLDIDHVFCLDYTRVSSSSERAVTYDTPPVIPAADLSPASEEKCSICLDVLGDTNKATTPCGHSFCFTCLYQSIEKQNSCPLCRATLIEKKKKTMRKLSNEALADIITETLNDFNLRRHVQSAELFANNRNNLDFDDIVCSSVQIYSLQLANNIQRQQTRPNYYYEEGSDDDDDDDDDDDEESDDEEENINL